MELEQTHKRNSTHKNICLQNTKLRSEREYGRKQRQRQLALIEGDKMAKLIVGVFYLF